MFLKKEDNILPKICSSVRKAGIFQSQNLFGRVRKSDIPIAIGTKPMRCELRNLGFAPKGAAKVRWTFERGCGKLDFQERARDIFVSIFFATFFIKEKK